VPKSPEVKPSLGLKEESGEQGGVYAILYTHFP
jgi:hypothetical protein